MSYFLLVFCFAKLYEAESTFVGVHKQIYVQNEVVLAPQIAIIASFTTDVLAILSPNEDRQKGFEATLELSV